MQLVDWLILICTLLFIVGYGVWKTRGSKNVEDYLRGSRSDWFTVGVSVMATQASAITFLSTPGQAFHDGMGFVQFYFGLPIAMVIICLFFIPLYHKWNVYTAYEYLESRFGLHTRVLTATLFLIQRGLSAGITIFAPSIILSVILGWNLIYLNIIIGLLVIIYTVSGGTRAVSVTQKQQMAVMIGGLAVAFVFLLYYLPDEITLTNAFEIAAASGKMNILDFSFNLDNRYTVWSGIIGGTFLALSYFGTDQSQVQRYLSGSSPRQSRMGLVMNGILKVPMQFFILLIGVMVFVFYQFNTSPINFNPLAEKAIINSAYETDYRELQSDNQKLFNTKKELIFDFSRAEEEERKILQEQIAALNNTDRVQRNKAKEIIKKADSYAETNDKDYVFIHFILNHLPKGVIGLLLAMVFSAAMSSTASELNALATTTTIDLYRRNEKKERPEAHYLKVSKGFTVFWGIMAILFACVANLFENLIQMVNIIGSIFYGNVLGIFLLAFFVRFVKGQAAFFAAVITQLTIFGIYYFAIYRPQQIGQEATLSYLWLNLIGCALVMLLGIIIQFFTKKASEK